MNHQKAWLRPRSGQAIYEASFTVVGRPYKARLGYLDPKASAELKKQVDDQLAKGVIRKSKSPWSARPFCIPKKTGEIRVVIDFRELNKCMVSDSYPLPRLWDIIREASHHVWYICLDCNWGFWNVPIKEECRQYTAFVTPWGIYEFNVLPFGIKNSPGEYQRAMDAAFSGILGDGVFCYVDDIVIYANILDDLIKKFRNVLEICETHGFYLKLSKSELAKHEVRLLGHMVGTNGIRPDPSKVAAIVAVQPPRNKDELRTFLGAAGFHRRFIPRYAEIADPLFRLLRKTADYLWTKDQQVAFCLIKDAITEGALLARPDPSSPYLLLTDASNQGIGAVLLQLQGDPAELTPLEYASKRLTPAEKKWDVRERELFAIKWAVQKWEEYLKGSPFMIGTDHRNLVYLKAATLGKVARWGLYLQQFPHSVLYLPGEHNVVADWLSRADNYPNEDTELEEMAMRTPEVSVFQVTKPNPTPVTLPTLEAVASASTTAPVEELKQCIRTDDGLYRHAHSRTLYIPACYRDAFLAWFHLGPSGGHCGVGRTVKRMKRWIWWPYLAKSTQEFIKTCWVCRRRGQPSVGNTEVMGSLQKPVSLDTISLDLIGPRKWHDKTYYILVVIDHCTRFMSTALLEDKRASTVLTNFLQCWIQHLSCPKVILTDNGKEFDEPFSGYVNSTLGCRHIRSAPYHPVGNGINEASHRSLSAAIAASAQEGREDFHQILVMATLVHNAVPHSATGISPYGALFGREPLLPGWQGYQVDTSESDRLSNIQETALQHQMRKSINEMQPKHTSAVLLRHGDLCVYSLPAATRPHVAPEALSIDRKLQPVWSAPMVVVAVSKTQAQIRPYGAAGPVKRFALTDIRKLEASGSAYLQELNQFILDRHYPRVPCPCPIGKCTCEDIITIRRQPKRVRTLQSDEQDPELSDIIP